MLVVLCFDLCIFVLMIFQHACTLYTERKNGQDLPLKLLHSHDFIYHTENTDLYTYFSESHWKSPKFVFILRSSEAQISYQVPFIITNYHFKV